MSDQTIINSNLQREELEINHASIETSKNLTTGTLESLSNIDGFTDTNLMPTDNCFHSIFGANTPDWTKTTIKKEKEAQSENETTMVSSASDDLTHDKPSIPDDKKAFLSQKAYGQYQSTLKSKIKCPNCFFTTINKGNLKQHMKKHDKPEGHVYTCDICDFKTKYKNSIKGHRARHERSGPKRRKK